MKGIGFPGAFSLTLRCAQMPEKALRTFHTTARLRYTALASCLKYKITAG